MDPTPYSLLPTPYSLFSITMAINHNHTPPTDPTPEPPEEHEVELSLRPTILSEYIGQEKLKKNLNILLGAAKQRGEATEHILLYGPPGLGKTTLANIIAKEMNVNIVSTSGPAIEKEIGRASCRERE